MTVLSTHNFECTNMLTKPIYMHKDQCMQILNLSSPDPPTILNELPKSIAKEISDLSSSENILHDAIPVYKEALKKWFYFWASIYT